MFYYSVQIMRERHSSNNVALWFADTVYKIKFYLLTAME